MVQSKLGTALAIRGERESGTEHLEQADKVYRTVLQDWSRSMHRTPGR